MQYKLSGLMAVGALVLVLSGCMTFNHIIDHYSSENTQTGKVTTAEGDFKIMDNASEGRMMVTFSGMGTVYKGTPPLPWARDAAIAWMHETGRSETCEFTEGYLFQAPQYEFLYACQTAEPQPAEPRGAE